MFILILIVSVVKIISAINKHKKVKYTITDKLVVIEGGSEGVVTIAKEEIKFIDISVGPIEKKYDAGTVLIHTGEFIKDETGDHKKYYKIQCVADPVGVVKIL